MKLVKAYIRHRKTEEVYQALQAEGFGALTLVECEGTGKYTDREEEHLSDKFPFTDAYKVIKVEILVPDSDINKVVKTIKEYGRTGHPGDGMVLVSPVDEVYKIRNEETGIDSV
ncbi:MAG: P-II family nitrogen regulator [Bacteroidota bacterium]